MKQTYETLIYQSYFCLCREHKDKELVYIWKPTCLYFHEIVTVTNKR